MTSSVGDTSDSPACSVFDRLSSWVSTRSVKLSSAGRLGSLGTASDLVHISEIINYKTHFIWTASLGLSLSIALVPGRVYRYRVDKRCVIRIVAHRTPHGFCRLSAGRFLEAITA